MKKILVGVVALAVAGGGVWLTLGGSGPEAAAPAASEAEAESGAEMVSVTMPALEGDALMGQRVFEAKCAACHGPNAGGIEGAGPPLIHKIYEPGHHGDMAFYLAAAQGVRAHHWKFGNMPPVEGVSEAEIGSVVAFVRQVQVANGID
jgi:mono/diheme cytochrome c family protein